MKGVQVVFVFILALTLGFTKVLGSKEKLSPGNAPRASSEESSEDGSIESTSDSKEDSLHNEVQKKQMKGKKVKSTFLPVPLPTDFQMYDILNKDGFISLEELVNVTEAKENVELAFSASDKNGDGLLSEEEFNTAPWMLQGDPKVNDEKVKELEQRFHNQPSSPPTQTLAVKKQKPGKTKLS